MKTNNINTINIAAPTVFYKAFKDNSGALELARSPKLTPRTNTSIIAIIIFANPYAYVSYNYLPFLQWIN